MLGNEIVSHLLLTFAYFLAVSLLRWQLDLSLFWLWSGAFLGTFLLDLDHLLYWFFSHPEKQDSQYARVLLKTRNFRGMYGLLQRTHRAHVRLTFHSAIFQLILLALAFYILSSGGSLFGSALVMAMNLHLLKDEWADFLKGKKEALVDWLFWQIKGVAMERYLRLYLWGATAVFLLLSLILI